MHQIVSVGPHDVIVTGVAVMVSLRLPSLKMAVHLRSLCSFARLRTYAKWSFSSSLKSSVKAAQVSSLSGGCLVIARRSNNKVRHNTSLYASEDNMLASI